MMLLRVNAVPWLYLFLIVRCRHCQAFIPAMFSTSKSHDPILSAKRRQTPAHTLPFSSGHQSPASTITMPRSRTQLSMKSGKGATNDDKDDDPSSLSWLWKLTLPLWLVYISNQWSRTSLYYTVDFSQAATDFNAMNVALDFDEAQYGLLASVAFTSLFAIASLGAGIASDRLDRKVLTIASAASWSLATLGTSMADSYTTVVLCRIAMGLACAFSTPTAYTLIQQGVPKARVGLASSLYGTGVALGSGVASLTLLLDNQVGWREAMTDVSIFGGVATLVAVLLLPDDPKREQGEEQTSSGDNAKNNNKKDLAAAIEEPSTIVKDISEAFSTTRAKWIFGGSFLRFCSGLCIGVWSAPYFRMVFSDSQSDYAVTQGVISAVGASVSGLLGGAVADWLNEQATAANDPDPTGRRLWVPVVGSLLAAPAWYFAISSDQSFETAMAWLATEYFVAECWFGPTISTLQATVGPRIGGTAQGLFTLTGALANFAPSLLGFLYGQATSSEGGESSAALSSLLAIGVGAGYVSSAACFVVAANSPPDAQLESERGKKLS